MAAEPLGWWVMNVSVHSRSLAFPRHEQSPQLAALLIPVSLGYFGSHSFLPPPLKLFIHLKFFNLCLHGVCVHPGMQKEHRNIKTS